jgi:hypothetical protein
MQELHLETFADNTAKKVAKVTPLKLLPTLFLKGMRLLFKGASAIVAFANDTASKTDATTSVRNPHPRLLKIRH